jgi:hypothetical protein
MMESVDILQDTMDRVGVDLVFASGTIKGISEQKIEDISDYSSPYSVSKNAYSFIVLMSSIKELEVSANDEFTLTVFSRKFTFLVGTFTEDLTGFVLMYVTMTGVEDV